MDCARFEDSLFDELDGRLGAERRRQLDEHLHGCARCRELRALLQGSASAGLAAGGAPEELLPAVLEHTTVAVSRAMARMLDELPELAELDPGDGFVAGVLAATVGSRSPARTACRRHLERAWSPWRERLQGVGARLLQRPRLALEGAYAGVLVALLLLGLPSPSLAQLPVRAYEGIRQEALGVHREVSVRVDVALDYGLAAWQDSTDRLTGYLETRAGEVLEAPQMERAAGWLAAVRDMVTGIWEHLFAPVAQELRALWDGAPDNDISLDRNQ